MRIFNTLIDVSMVSIIDLPKHSKLRISEIKNALANVSKRQNRYSLFFDKRLAIDKIKDVILSNLLLVLN
jgi:hypothetical protein